MRFIARDSRIWLVSLLVLIVGGLDLELRKQPAKACPTCDGGHEVSQVNYTCYPFLPNDAYIALAGSCVAAPLGDIVELKTYIKNKSTNVVTTKLNTSALFEDPNDPDQSIYSGDTKMMPKADYRVWAEAKLDDNSIIRSNVFDTNGCGGTVTSLGYITP